MEQLGFEIPRSDHEIVIAVHAEAWRENTRRMVAEANACINRMCGQFMRHNRQRAELEALRFYFNRGDKNA